MLSVSVVRQYRKVQMTENNEVFLGEKYSSRNTITFYANREYEKCININY